MFSINDLKKHLGPGLGLRKNKYLLEIPIPGVSGAKLNVLARSAGLPERNITTSSVYHKGRKYNIRGESDFVGTYDVSIVDDSRMNIRKRFDTWFRLIDDSKPANAGFLGASYESGVSDVLNNLKSGLTVANIGKRALENPGDAAGDYLTGLIDPGQRHALAAYQTDINIWQLDNNDNKVYGYKLQNAFPSQMGVVTLDDDDSNTLSEFSIQFTFSEMIPLEGISPESKVLTALGGDSIRDAALGIEALIE